SRNTDTQKKIGFNGMETGKYTYKVSAFAPDPDSGERYFTFNGIVNRSELMDSERQYDILLQGLSDHVHSVTGVRCSPNSFALQSVQQVSAESPIVLIPL
ncbi:hypothetical protein WH50_11890, partial [Pokkaliibacter plantistimulans]